MAERRGTARRRGGRHRESLLLGTALGAAFAGAALAQAPDARPQGGAVVAGSASIARSATNTLITQGSSRAVIDWSGFDVGRTQSVTFAQPSASAVALNRVNAAEPSRIAGRITANGQIVIQNRAGITFAEGAQVDAHALVATAAGMSAESFMAGSTRFDIPAKPGAAVVNRGRITVAQTGLAALVAPNVANSGVIEAKLGRVVLAGAATHTLDLYGDGLLAIDVGGDGKVVNTGTIRAEGGRVLLSAAAADGIVSTMVEAGGRISADSAAGRPGAVRIQATGGSIVIEGRVSAAGRAPGTTGGSIEVMATGTATLRDTARLNADGRAGGGRIAVGGAGADTVAILAGARISADATGAGRGGAVTVLSDRRTAMAGRITARGGRTGGDGGAVEVSGRQGYTLTGTVDVSAARGAAGTILIDPQDLTIIAGGADNALFQAGGGGDGQVAAGSNGGSPSPVVAAIDPSVFENLTGNVTLQAARDLFVLSPVTAHATLLSLQAGRNLTVAAPLALVGAGTVALSAAVSAFASVPGYDAAGGPGGLLLVSGSVLAPDGAVALASATGGVRIDGQVQAARLSVATTGSLVAGGTVAAELLTGSAEQAAFAGAANAIAALGDFTVRTSSISRPQAT